MFVVDFGLVGKVLVIVLLSDSGERIFNVSLIVR